MKYSIVIPAKDEGKNLARCLDALKNLDCPKEDFEIIVVDNGSTDNTVEIAKSFGIGVYERPDLSLSGLRNYGAEFAKGETLAFLDADCIAEKDWLANASATLLDPRAGCTGSTPIAPDQGPWVEKIWSSFRTRKRNRCRGLWINSSNFIVRRELFEKIDGFNDMVKTCEDVDICLRLQKVCDIIYDPSVKVVHLGEPKNITQFFHKEVWRGKGYWSGLKSHGFVPSELKSILLPLYYIVMAVLFVGLLISQGIDRWEGAALMATLYFGPAILFSIWISQTTGMWRYFIGYFVLFIVYANARAFALIQR